MAGKGIRAAKAFVELRADDSLLTKALKVNANRLAAWGSWVVKLGAKIFAAGAAITAPLNAAAVAAANAASEIKGISDRTGVSVEKLQAWGLATDAFEGSMNDLGKKLLANDDAFEKLGLSVAKLRTMKPEDQFREIADRISKIENPTLRNAMAVKLFGANAGSMTKQLAGGSAGLDEMEKKARSLGQVLSQDDVAAGAKLTSAIGDITSSVKTLWMQVGTALVPTLQEFVDLAGGVVRGAVKWVMQNRQLIVTVSRVGAIVAVVGAAVASLGVPLLAAGALFAKVSTIGWGFLSVFASMLTIIPSFGMAIFGFIVSPVGIAAAAVVALTMKLRGFTVSLSEVATWLTSGFGSAVSYFSDGLKQIWNDTSQTLTALGQALSAGDLALAAQVLWAFLKLEWTKGVAALNQIWEVTWKTSFVQTALGTIFNVARFFTDTWFDVEKTFGSVVDGMMDAFSMFTGWILKTWNKVTGFIAKTWAAIKSTLDSSEEREKIDQRTEALNRMEDNTTNADIGGRDAARQQRAEKIEADRKSAEAWMKQMEGGLKTAADGAAAGIADELTAAQAAWSAAVKDAAGKTAPVSGAMSALDKPKFDFDPSVMDKAKGMTTGSFSGRAVMQMGGGSAAERTAKATEKTNDYLKTLITKVDSGKTMTFANAV